MNVQKSSEECIFCCCARKLPNILRKSSSTYLMS
jgi:hypothetical protein